MDLSEKELEIGKIIVDVNLLFQYPLSVDQISDWSKRLNKTKPDMYLEDLKIAMDKLIVADVEFNPAIGIQNIFVALKSLERPMVY